MENGIFIHKGTHPDIESYSAFWDNNKIMQTKLFEHMKQKKITDLYVCGLAYDVCVGNYRTNWKTQHSCWNLLTSKSDTYQNEFLTLNWNISCWILGATANHSLEYGFRTILVEDACRGVSLEDMGSTRQSLTDQNALVVTSSEVNCLWTNNRKLHHILKLWRGFVMISEIVFGFEQITRNT